MTDKATVGRDQVVSFTYTLKDEGGQVLDSNVDGPPLVYLHGHGQIVPGLENELEGRTVGDSVNITVPPEEGYGEHDPERVFSVPKDRFQPDVEAGDIVRGQTDEGMSPPLMVTEVGEVEVKLDGNHPLAGKTLNFEVEVADIRPATEEELEHGHVHGEHDHGHSH